MLEIKHTSRSFNLNKSWVSTGLRANTSQELVSSLLKRIAAKALGKWLCYIQNGLCATFKIENLDLFPVFGITC